MMSDSEPYGLSWDVKTVGDRVANIPDLTAVLNDSTPEDDDPTEELSEEDEELEMNLAVFQLGRVFRVRRSGSVTWDFRDDQIFAISSVLSADTGTYRATAIEFPDLSVEDRIEHHARIGLLEAIAQAIMNGVRPAEADVGEIDS
ncbi:hypothetical protein B2J88_01675 [Rhodococcus sp. SRB_17]|nr:hypothetical protein [Rhodococcus sp. SRB_17]